MTPRARKIFRCSRRAAKMKHLTRDSVIGWQSVDPGQQMQMVSERQPTEQLAANCTPKQRTGDFRLSVGLDGLSYSRTKCQSASVFAGKSGATFTPKCTPGQRTSHQNRTDPSVTCTTWTVSRASPLASSRRQSHRTRTKSPSNGVNRICIEKRNSAKALVILTCGQTRHSTVSAGITDSCSCDRPSTS